MRGVAGAEAAIPLVGVNDTPLGVNALDVMLHLVGAGVSADFVGIGAAGAFVGVANEWNSVAGIFHSIAHVRKGLRQVALVRKVCLSVCLWVGGEGKGERRWQQNCRDAQSVTKENPKRKKSIENLLAKLFLFLLFQDPHCVFSHGNKVTSSHL